MDLNGNKETGSDVCPSEEPSMDSTASNVQSLKLFFQNQKIPIIGFKPLTTNTLDSTSAQQSHSCAEDSSAKVTDSEEKRPPNRNKRSIPRPPKQIQSCDIKVSPFLKSLVTNQCESSSVPSIPPVPMPRKSLIQRMKTLDIIDPNCNSSEKRLDFGVNNENLIDPRPISLIESVTKELNSNLTKLRTHSLHCTSNPNQINDNQTEIIKTDNRSQSSDLIFVPSLSSDNSSESKKPQPTKSKKSFKLFLRKSKLLSLRKTSSDKSQPNPPVSVAQTKPMKPTRNPPKPPVLHFRPPAPLPPQEPNEDYYEDTLSAAADNPSVGVCGYELYNDNDNRETEQIYWSLDNEDEYDSDYDIYDRIDDYDDGRNDKSYDNYYEDSIDNLDNDCDRIYEVLPFEKDFPTDTESFGSNGSTISLDDNQNKIQTVSEVENKRSKNCDQKLGTFERKLNLKTIKLKKKFNLRGDEIPVSAGIVKQDYKGNRYDLFVQKGETVLILRMEGNPPGKYLAKNERSKVGFVNLDNISFDAENVKCIIKTLASTVSSVSSASTPSSTQNKHSD